MKDVRAEIGEETIRILVAAAGDAQVEIWDANRKTDLLEDVAGRSVEVALAG